MSHLACRCPNPLPVRDLVQCWTECSRVDFECDPCEGSLRMFLTTKPGSFLGSREKRLAGGSMRGPSLPQARQELLSNWCPSWRNLPTQRDQSSGDVSRTERPFSPNADGSWVIPHFRAKREEPARARSSMHSSASLQDVQPCSQGSQSVKLGMVSICI